MSLKSWDSEKLRSRERNVENLKLNLNHFESAEKIILSTHLSSSGQSQGGGLWLLLSMNLHLGTALRNKKRIQSY